MRKQYLLGIDVGGSGVKVGLFATDGTLVGLHSETIPVDSREPGWAEIDPGHWVAAISRAVPAVLGQASIEGQSVAAIGLSNMIGTVVPVDDAGASLRPAIAYFDTRATREARWMLQQAPEIPRVTANRVTAGNTSLSSILWLRDHETEVFEAAARFLPTGSFVYRWLTGGDQVDWTTASFVGAFDYRRTNWSAAICTKLHFDPQRLPEVASPQTVTPLRVDVAHALGLQPGTPVALGGIDGAMSSVGVGAVRPGDAFDVSGTSEMIALCLPNPTVSPELLARWHVVPDVWVLIGAMSTSGAAWRWVADTLWAEDKPSGDSALRYEAMTQAAAEVPPGSHGVVFLPHLMGERAPIWDSDARGVFFGLHLATTRADMVRAVMEGTAFAMRHLIETIEIHSGVPLQRIVTMGGPARNTLWLQIKADVWNVALAVPSVTESTVLGAAITAGVSAGVYDDWQDAVARAVPPPERTVEPSLARHRQYDRRYRVYRRLYPALAETMRFAAEHDQSKDN